MGNAYKGFVGKIVHWEDLVTDGRTVKTNRIEIIYGCADWIPAPWQVGLLVTLHSAVPLLSLSRV
jgi:hypothetical protein